MKIAVSSEGRGMDGQISEHFRKCSEFVLVEADKDQVKSVEVIKNPYFESPVPGTLPDFIKKIGADVVITGGAGPMAIKAFEERDIKLVLGCKGNVSDAVSEYLRGTLRVGSNSCEH